MALPKLNAVPKYELTLPSFKSPIKFRPFLVKEEKVLMIAAESEDPRQMIGALADIVENCIDANIDRSQMTSTDVEYAFLKIRAKSVGENANIGLSCPHCNAVNSVDVNVDEIETPKVSKLKDKIEVDKNIFIELQQPSFDAILETTTENSTAADSLLKIVCKCIVGIKTEDEYIKTADISEEELIEFVESMDTKQFNLIREFVEQLPRIQHTVNYKCEKCGSDNEFTIEGIQSFLS